MFNKNMMGYNKGPQIFFQSENLDKKKKKKKKTRNEIYT